MSDSEDLLETSFYLTLSHWGQNVSIQSFGVLTLGSGYQCAYIGVLTKFWRHLIIKKCLITVAMFFWKSSYSFSWEVESILLIYMCAALDLRMVSVQHLRSPYPGGAAVLGII